MLGVRLSAWTNASLESISGSAKKKGERYVITALETALQWILLEMFARIPQRPGTMPRRGILTYHDISTVGTPISVAPDTFRAHMAYLHSNGIRGVSVDEFLTAVASGDNAASRNLMAISFDDGFASVHDEALPILREYGFTATVYVLAHKLGGRSDWRRLGTIPDLPLMGPAPLRACLKAGWEIGSHGLDHHPLTEGRPVEVARQMRTSRAELESLFACPVYSFCYPYGAFTRDHCVAARDAGYRSATTIRVGYIENPLVRPFAFPRLGMNIVRTDPRLQQALLKATVKGHAMRFVKLRRILTRRPHHSGEGAVPCV